MKKTISFDRLMGKVKYHAALKNKPYCLTFDGAAYGFEDTKEIVPFVKSLGWEVTGL